MGRIVFAAAMSHVLDPDYYERVRRGATQDRRGHGRHRRDG